MTPKHADNTLPREHGPPSSLIWIPFCPAAPVCRAGMGIRRDALPPPGAPALLCLSARLRESREERWEALGAGQPLRCAQDPSQGANNQYSGSDMTKAPGFVHGGDSPALSEPPGDGIVHRWQQITRGSSGTSSSQRQMHRWAVSSSLGSTVPLESLPCCFTLSLGLQEMGVKSC